MSMEDYLQEFGRAGRDGNAAVARLVYRVEDFGAAAHFGPEREMVVELEQPGAEKPVRLLGAPFKLSRTPAQPTRAPGPVLGEHTDEVLAGADYGPEEIAALHEAGAVAGPAGTVQGSFIGA